MSINVTAAAAFLNAQDNDTKLALQDMMDVIEIMADYYMVNPFNAVITLASIDQSILNEVEDCEDLDLAYVNAARAEVGDAITEQRLENIELRSIQAEAGLGIPSADFKQFPVLLQYIQVSGALDSVAVEA